MGETMGIFWILIVGLLQFIVVGGSDLRYELPARSLQSVEAKKDPPCIPIEGKTAIVIGQDYESISNYTAAFTSNTQPFGLMAYTALRNQYGDLAGLMNPIDYGSGIEWAQGLMEKYPSSSIQLGIWLVDQLELVVHGQLDAPIHSLIQFVNQSSTTPFYIRLGYEFDSVENNYNPNVYQQMFQYVVKKFRDAKISNAHFVWHASGFKPRDNIPLADWFPGEQYVDWCGVSLFQQPYQCEGSSACSLEYADFVGSFCRDKHLPLMIAESSPFGGIIDEKLARANPELVNDAGYKGSTWNRWFTPVFGFVQRHNVRMWCYINANWDAQPMWQERHEKGVSWGDTRLEKYKEIADKWRKVVLSSRRSMKSYDFSAKRCENFPSPNATHSDFLEPISALFSGNSTAYKKRIPRSFEEELALDAKDVLLVVLKFVEVMILLVFSMVVVLIIVAAAYKVVLQYYERESYTTIN